MRRWDIRIGYSSNRQLLLQSLPGDNVNRINPKKLLNSKWTAAAPKNKEKHFLVTAIEFDEEGLVTSCEIEAVMSKRAQPIQWQELKDTTQWLHGWQ